MAMTELCSICTQDVSEETAYVCNECYEADKLQLLCSACAYHHSITISLVGNTHTVEKVK